MDIRHTVSTFLESFYNSMITQLEQSPPKSATNLTKQEKLALKELSKRDDVIFCNADQGSAVVIMIAEDYIKELNDTSVYKILHNNPTCTHCALFNSIINMFKEIKQLENKLA